MSGGVYYVDLDSVSHNGGVLCKDGDTAFTLKVAGVHDSLADHLIFVILAALLQHLVNEGSLTVVNVGYDSYISEVFSDHIMFASSLLWLSKFIQISLYHNFRVLKRFF